MLLESIHPNAVWKEVHELAVRGFFLFCFFFNEFVEAFILNKGKTLSSELSFSQRLSDCSLKDLKGFKEIGDQNSLGLKRWGWCGGFSDANHNKNEKPIFTIRLLNLNF